MPVERKSVSAVLWAVLLLTGLMSLAPFLWIVAGSFSQSLPGADKLAGTDQGPSQASSAGRQRPDGHFPVLRLRKERLGR